MSPTLKRTADLNYLDQVVRSPGVWKRCATMRRHPERIHVGADPEAAEYFSHGPARRDPAGFFAFCQSEKTTYEMHTNLLPICRGAAAIHAAWRAIAWLFNHTAAQQIETYVFETARPARLLLTLARWRETARRLHPATVDGHPLQEIWFTFTRSEWAARQP